jgi:hypothetical protein
MIKNQKTMSGQNFDVDYLDETDPNTLLTPVHWTGFKNCTHEPLENLNPLLLSSIDSKILFQYVKEQKNEYIEQELTKRKHIKIIDGLFAAITDHSNAIDECKQEQNRLFNNPKATSVNENSRKRKHKPSMVTKTIVTPSPKKKSKLPAVIKLKREVKLEYDSSRVKRKLNF